MKEFLETLYQVLAESTDDFIYMNDCQTGVFQYPGAFTKLFTLPKESRNAPLSDWKKLCIRMTGRGFTIPIWKLCRI